VAELTDENGRDLNRLVRDEVDQRAHQKRQPSLVIQYQQSEAGQVLMANDGRGGRRWFWCESEPTTADLLSFLEILAAADGRSQLVWPHGEITRVARRLVAEHGGQLLQLTGGQVELPLTAYAAASADGTKVTPIRTSNQTSSDKRSPMEMSQLDRLEAESIHIIREVMAEAENPVMLYSIGKDSAVMLRLAQKAFYPSRPPFPLMHIDTRWKFQAMYQFRDRIAEDTGMDLIVHINPEGVEKNINPFDHGSALHTDIMKTQGLIQALDKYKFDVAFGGARRDEEKSRAKERVFSFRNAAHRWDPKNQRPELWNLYNGRKKPGESIRVFPLSNWTELDIWQYIYRENIPIVPLYYAAERPVVERDGMLMMVDDDRLKLFPGEKIQTKKVRFRTLGCYPLTGAVESEADDLPSILLELLEARTSERQGRAIDTDSAGSMEKKKQEGYF
jgi:sulfate adenylyltransferase subunit 2